MSSFTNVWKRNARIGVCTLLEDARVKFNSGLPVLLTSVIAFINHLLTLPHYYLLFRLFLFPWFHLYLLFFRSHVCAVPHLVTVSPSLSNFTFLYTLLRSFHKSFLRFNRSIVGWMVASCVCREWKHVIWITHTTGCLTSIGNYRLPTPRYRPMNLELIDWRDWLIISS